MVVVYHFGSPIILALAVYAVYIPNILLGPFVGVWIDRLNRKYVFCADGIDCRAVRCLLHYFFVHEGAHLLCALLAGVYKQINFMGLGVQIDVYAERMTDTQLGIFCLMGVFATLCIGYLLTALVKNICRIKNKLLRAMIYYITIALLLLDPLYLSFFCSFLAAGI